MPSDPEADTRGVEAPTYNGYVRKDAYDAEVAKRREAERELAGWIVNAREFSAKNGELHAEVQRLTRERDQARAELDGWKADFSDQEAVIAEVQRLRAALERIHDLYADSTPEGDDLAVLVNIHAIAAAALDREGEA